MWSLTPLKAGLQYNKSMQGTPDYFTHDNATYHELNDLSSSLPFSRQVKNHNLGCQLVSTYNSSSSGATTRIFYLILAKLRCEFLDTCPLARTCLVQPRSPNSVTKVLEKIGYHRALMMPFTLLVVL